MLRRRDILGVIASVAIGSEFPVRAQPPISERAKHLLLVHGRGQGGRKRDEIQNEWITALRKGAAKNRQDLAPSVEIALPFYGDVLDQFVREAQIPLTSEVQARGNPMTDDFLVFQYDLANEIRARQGISDEQVKIEYGEEVQEQDRGPLNWRWVQAILRTIDKNSASVSQSTLESFTRDVYLYLKFPRIRSTIDDIVGSSLTSEPTVVIGHSLGSVVAFNVLGRSNYRAPRFVTVGSPLAVRAVRARLEPIRTPASVSAWFNAYDPRDVVSLYPLDKDNFNVSPPIENYGAVANWTDNRHGIVGYLDDAEVARRVIDGLAA